MFVSVAVPFESGSPLSQGLSESLSETPLQKDKRQDSLGHSIGYCKAVIIMFVTPGRYNNHDCYVDLHVSACKPHNLPRCYTFSIVHSAWCVGSESEGKCAVYRKHM